MKFKMYTKTNCPYCVHAKNWLVARKANYEEVNVETTPGAREELMEKYPEVRSVPHIVMVDSNGEEALGGYQELVKRADEVADIIERYKTV